MLILTVPIRISDPTDIEIGIWIKAAESYCGVTSPLGIVTSFEQKIDLYIQRVSRR